VILLGFGSFIGRLFIGIGSDYLTISRPTYNIYSSCIMSCSYLLLIFFAKYILYPICFTIGISYGIFFSINASFIADMFGSLHHASNYGAIDLASSAGSLFFATFIVNLFYEHNDQYSDNCIGIDCFQNTFIICTCVCAAAAILSAIVTKRTQKHYETLKTMTKR
jgi:sugar phosphate permease